METFGGSQFYLAAAADTVAAMVFGTNLKAHWVERHLAPLSGGLICTDVRGRAIYVD